MTNQIKNLEEVYKNKKTGELIDCVTLSSGTRYFSSRRLKELNPNEIDLSCRPYIIPKDIILTDEEFDKLYEKLN